jgi:cytochrome b
VIFRVLWGFAGSSTARFSSWVRGPRAVLEYLKKMACGVLPLATSHNPAGAVMVLLLLGLLLAQTITGLFANDEIFSEGPLAHLVSSATSGRLTELHGLIFNGLLAAAGFHVLAVLYYLVRGKNLIGAMVTGRKSPQLISPNDHSEIRMAPLWRASVLLAVSILIVWALRWI